MGSVKGSTVETTETPDGGHVKSSGHVDVPGELSAMVPQVSVQMGLGFTEPTKPYGNVKFYCSITIPCNIGEQDDIANFAEEWVSERCGKAMNDIKEQYPD